MAFQSAFDAFRQQLMGYVVSVCSQMNLPVKLPNTPFNQPKDGSIWAEFHVMYGETGPAELGGGAAQLERTCCVFQFDVLGPENQGDGPQMLIANTLKDAFNKLQMTCGSFGYFKTDIASVKPAPFAPRGFYRIIVDGGLDFFHRKTQTF